MARDARGISLKEGDTVSLEIPSTRVVGDIQKIAHGGIVTGMRGGHDRISMGSVTVLVAFEIALDPSNPIIPNALKLHQEKQEPEPEPSGLVALN